MLKLKFVPIVFLACCIAGCNPQTSTTDAGHDSTDSIAASTVLVKEDSVSYSAGTINFKSFVAFKQDNHKKPIVLVVPEWWGVNDYIKSRVRQLAELGYLAFAVDMYGDGKNVITPDEAGKLAVPFYKNPGMAQAHFNAAMTKAKNYPDADTSKIAAIGYCFGGSMVLNMARLGEPLKAVVSFHGDLNNYGLLPTKGASTPAVLVLHGEADSMVPPEIVKGFKREMDSARVNYKFIGYPGARHAFTNPAATAVGEKYKIDIAYNEAADKSSWEEMKVFLADIFK